MNAEPKYPTSPELENIVSRYRLNACELLPMPPHGFGTVFRVNFVDDGIKHAAGAVAIKIANNANPREFASTLREMADALDASWARLYPATLTNSEERLEEK